jgi:trans-aconitate methyltransferase
MIEKGLNVIGIDFSSEMIEIAKREVPKGEFHVMDLNKLGDLSKQFEGIFARAVLLHIPKKEIPSTLSKLKNCLKDHGYLYIAVKEKRESENDEEIVKENDYGADIERFFSYFTLLELEKILSDAHLNIVFSEITTVKSGTRKWIQIIAQK